MKFSLKCKEPDCEETLTQHNQCYAHGETGEDYHCHAGGYYKTEYRCKVHGNQTPFQVNVTMCECDICQDLRNRCTEALVEKLKYGSPIRSLTDEEVERLRNETWALAAEWEALIKTASKGDSE